MGDEVGCEGSFPSSSSSSSSSIPPPRARPIPQRRGTRAGPSLEPQVYGSRGVTLGAAPCSPSIRALVAHTLLGLLQRRDGHYSHPARASQTVMITRQRLVAAAPTPVGPMGPIGPRARIAGGRPIGLMGPGSREMACSPPQRAPIWRPQSLGLPERFGPPTHALVPNPLRCCHLRRRRLFPTIAQNRSIVAP